MKFIYELQRKLQYFYAGNVQRINSSSIHLYHIHVNTY